MFPSNASRIETVRAATSVIHDTQVRQTDIHVVSELTLRLHSVVMMGNKFPN